MERKQFFKKLPLILFDVISIILAITVATIIANNETDGPTNYVYYVPYYIVGLTFLQMASYFALGVYELDVYNFELKDLKMLLIGNGVVLVCNIITILITGWFTILWGIFYSVIFIALSCGIRFIFRVSVIRKQEKRELEEEKELDKNSINK